MGINNNNSPLKKLVEATGSKDKGEFDSAIQLLKHRAVVDLPDYNTRTSSKRTR